MGKKVFLQAFFIIFLYRHILHYHRHQPKSYVLYENKVEKKNSYNREAVDKFGDRWNYE